MAVEKYEAEKTPLTSASGDLSRPRRKRNFRRESEDLRLNGAGNRREAMTLRRQLVYVREPDSGAGRSAPGPAKLGTDNFPGGRIENEPAAVCTAVVPIIVVEIKHAENCAARQHVEGLRVPNRPEAPVVLDKAQDGGRIVEAVIHEVPLGVR